MSASTTAPSLKLWHSVPGAVWLILLLYLALALGYNFVFPPFEPTDEFPHFRYIRHLIERRSFPVMTLDDPSEFHQPPGYYLLAAGLSAAAPADDFADYRQRLNPYWGYRHWEPGFDNKNLYVHGPWDLWPFRQTSLAVHAARLASLLLGCVTVMFTYQLARAWLDEATSTAATGAVAFQPMFLAVSGSLQTDAGSAALGAVILWLGLRLYQSGFTYRRALALGAVIGLGALFKLTISFLIGPITLLLLWWAWRRREPLPRTLGCLALLGLGAALVAGWWYARNQLIYGEPTGLGIDLKTYGSQPVALGVRLWPQSVPYAWTSFWGRFARGDLPLPDWIYALLTVLSALAVAGVILRVVVRREPSDRTPVLFLAIASLTEIAGLMTVLTLTPSGYFGRYVFPALSALMSLFVFGLQFYAGGRARTAITFAAPVGLFTLSSLTLVFYLYPAFNPPPAVAQLPPGAAPLEAPLGDVALVKGYEVNTNRARPGDEVYLTVYWRPLNRTELPYSVFIHLLDDEDTVVTQRDTYPGLGRNATTSWEPGRMFADRYKVVLPDTAYASNSTHWEVGLWQADTGERAFLVDASGQPVASGAAIPGPAIEARKGGTVNPVDLNFGDELRLQGYALPTRLLTPGKPFDLTLHWGQQGNPGRALEFFVHVRAADGSTWAEGAFRVQTGEQVIQPLLAAGAPPGVYDLIIGVYTEGDNGPERLKWLGVDGHEIGDEVRLTGLRVKSP